MHVPDGFFDAPVSVATGAVAVTAVAVSLKGARREFGGTSHAEGYGGERVTPLAGLVAAFIFAVQMLTFPVGAGTSGHLMGGALAAILVGPYTGVLCLSVVLLMQGLLFADGGLTALGINITLLGVVAVAVAYPLFRLLARVLPRGRRSVMAASFVAALVSVPVSAMVFTVLYAIGGTADVSLGKVFAAMVGVHTAIGIGEAVITALTVGAILAVRPDLVYGARGLTAPLVLRTAPAATAPDPEREPEPAPEPEPEPVTAARRPVRPVRPVRRVWLAGLAAALVCGGIVSYYASEELDGLARVSEDHGIAESEEEHGLADSPLADYGVEDVDNDRLSVGLAGVIGVGATLAIGSGVFYVVRRRQTAAAESEPQASPSESERV